MICKIVFGYLNIIMIFEYIKTLYTVFNSYIFATATTSSFILFSHLFKISGPTFSFIFKMLHRQIYIIYIYIIVFFSIDLIYFNLNNYFILLFKSF